MGSCAAPSAKGDDKFITTDYLQQCRQGDTAFPEALPVPPDVMQTFFPNIPVATPTTFLVNVNTLEALPLLQGATDAAGFMARMDTVLQMYGGKKGAK